MCILSEITYRWRLSLSTTTVRAICKVNALERGCWYGDGGFVVISRRSGGDAVDLGPRQQEDVPPSMCHNDMWIAACSELVIDSESLVGGGASLYKWQWWRLDVSSNILLGDVRVWQRPLASSSAENRRGNSDFSVRQGVISKFFRTAVFSGMFFISFHVYVFL
jgi:hypothetical protein